MTLFSNNALSVRHAYISLIILILDETSTPTSFPHSYFTLWTYNTLKLLNPQLKFSITFPSNKALSVLPIHMSSRSGPRKGSYGKSGTPSHNNRGRGNSSNGFRKGGGKGSRGSGSGYQDKHDRQPVPLKETVSSESKEQVIEPLKTPTPSTPSGTHKSYASVLVSSNPNAVGDDSLQQSKLASTASVDATAQNPTATLVSETTSSPLQSEDDLKSASEAPLKENNVTPPKPIVEAPEKQPVKVSWKLRADVPEFNPSAAEFTPSSKRYAHVPSRPVSAPPPPEIPSHQLFTAYTHLQSHKDIYSTTQANSSVPVSNTIVPPTPVVPRRSYNVLSPFQTARSGPGPSYPHVSYPAPYYPTPYVLISIYVSDLLLVLSNQYKQLVQLCKFHPRSARLCPSHGQMEP